MQMVPVLNMPSANQNPYSSPPMMLATRPAFHPGNQCNCHHKKKCSCKKGKKKKKKKKEKSESESDSDVEYFYMRKPAHDLGQRKDNRVYAPSRPQTVHQYVNEYNYITRDDRPEMVCEPQVQDTTAQYQRMVDDYNHSQDYYNWAMDDYVRYPHVYPTVAHGPYEYTGNVYDLHRILIHGDYGHGDGDGYGNGYGKGYGNGNGYGY